MARTYFRVIETTPTDSSGRRRASAVLYHNTRLGRKWKHAAERVFGLTVTATVNDTTLRSLPGLNFAVNRAASDASPHEEAAAAGRNISE
jgi:hypothetical protein